MLPTQTAAKSGKKKKGNNRVQKIGVGVAAACDGHFGADDSSDGVSTHQRGAILSFVTHSCPKTA